MAWLWNVLRWPVAVACVIVVTALLLIARPWQGGGTTAPLPLETNPVTTVVEGRKVFVIHPSPPCPANASCAAVVVINRKLWAFTDYPSPPKPIYRTGPLYAIGPKEEAHLITTISTATYQVVALRMGGDWFLAFSPAVPRTDGMQRQLCSLAESLPANSYCVSHLGFAPTSS